MRHINISLFTLLLSTQLNSTSLTPLPYGHGGLLYDAFPPNGPHANPSTNPMTNHPGFWVDQIQGFNTGTAPKYALSRLYVYGTSVDTSGDVNTIDYDTSFAAASVAAYRAQFPNLTILAIVDGTPGVLEKGDAATIALAKALASSLSSQVCADSNVDGVFFDIEPTKFTYTGLTTFYQTTASQLAANTCKDAQHPNGRYMGVFAYVNTADGKLVKPVLGSNGFLAVPLYDVRDTQPPTPTPMDLFNKNAKSLIYNSNVNSSAFNIPYTVVGPAASSFGEFEQYGSYTPPPPTPPAPYNFTLISKFSPTITQVLYMTTINANTLKYATSPYYMGVDYWAWNYFVSPNPKENQLLLPSYPDSATVTYLQQNAF